MRGSYLVETVEGKAFQLWAHLEKAGKEKDKIGDGLTPYRTPQP